MMMTAAETDRILRAAALLAAARQAGTTLPGLPDEARPASLAEAEAVQRASFAALGLTVGGWKVGRAGAAPIACPMPPALPDPDAPIRLPAGTLVEFELALRLTRDLAPSEVARLTPAAMPKLADLVPLFEFVAGRYAPDAAPGDLDKVAECLGNHAFLAGAPLGPWDWAAVEHPAVRLLLDGVEVARHAGPHRAMPLGPLIEAWRDRCVAEGAGLRAGQVITLGSLTGMLPLPASGCALRGEVDGRGTLACRVAPAG